MQKVVLWGTGGMTQILRHYIEKDNAYEICGYTLDREYIESGTFDSKPVVPFDEVEKIFPPNEYKMGILMSPKKLNKVREEKYKQAKQKGYSFINYISKDAICDATKIGENVFIFPFAFIGPFCEIGNNVVIWEQTHLGHNTKIGDNCSLAVPKIAGFCEIGGNTFLGVNATVADHTKVGEYSIIGAGSVVTKDVKPNSVLAVKRTPKMDMTSFELEGLIQ